MANSEATNSTGGSEIACAQNTPETLHSRQVRTVYLITFARPT